MKLSRIFIIGIAISALSVLLFLFPFLLHLDSPFGDHSDVDQAMFVVYNGYEKLAALDLSHLYESRMYYPNSQTITSGNSMLLPALMGLPMYLLTRNPVLSFNVTIVVNFFLTFLAMYLFAYYITKRISAAIAAGLLFTYNPYVTAHFLNIELIVLWIIPMIFLITEFFIRKRSTGLALALVFLFTAQLYASPYYAFFIAVCWPVYVLVRTRTASVSLRSFCRWQMIVPAVLLFLLTYTAFLPYKHFSESGGLRPDPEYTTLLSATLSDYISTAPSNRMYGWIHVRDAFARIHVTEHSLFPGITALTLFIMTLWFIRKGSFIAFEKSIVMSFIVVLTMSFVFSYGLHLPLYRFLYTFIPFVSSFRAVSRFGVMVFFSLAALGALTLSKKSRYIVGVSCILIIIEYSFVLPKPAPIPPDILKFYAWLDSSPQVHTVIELPMSNSLTDPVHGRDTAMDAQYLLYGIYHHKNIVNGYNSFIPASLLNLGNSLALNFPTEQKLQTLKELGVDTIIVHSEEFNEPLRGVALKASLKQFHLNVRYENGPVTAFAL